ncbi:MAG: Fe-S cluster assembly sulfur transfer protein SufU [Bacteroidota bacterium]
MDDFLKSIIQEFIISHDQKPHGFEIVKDADHTVEAYNPLCGDKYNVYLEIDGDVIKSIHFYGKGCTISKASTSVLVKNLLGKNLAEAKSLVELFLKNASSMEELEEEIPTDFEAFAAARYYPSRHTCACLSWSSLKDFLLNHHRVA